MRHLFLLLIVLSLLPLQAQDTAPPPDITIHIVQRGESLWRIARDYGISVEALAALNGLPPTSGIFAGQRLLVPDPAAAAITPPSAPPTVDSIHTVTRGETLFRIAQAHGVSVNDLIVANNLADPSLIYAGQRLLVPSRLVTAPAPARAYQPPIATVQVRPDIFVEGHTSVVVVTTTEPASVTVTFLGVTVAAIPDETRTTHTYLRGIPMFTPAGTFPLQIAATGTTVSTTLELPVVVRSGGYGTINLNLTPERAALLAPGIDEFELGILRSLASQVTLPRAFSGLMSLPAAAPMNAPFGTRRSINSGPVSRYHNGADFATPPGSPIFAAAPGRVVLADLLNIRGNSVMIDHGWGIFTLYAHLTSLSVRVGDHVTTGQVLGTSGSTGRVTGPHLHWEVWVGGVPVDPMLWTQQIYP